MSPALVQRQVLLAAVALLAAVLALALRSEPAAEPAPVRAVPTPDGGWYQATAASRLATRKARTACGYRLEPRSVGIAHPVLPCGTMIAIRYNDTEVVTTVVDQAPAGAGYEFDLTKALADTVGLRGGVQAISWRYAGRQRS